MNLRHFVLFTACAFAVLIVWSLQAGATLATPPAAYAIIQLTNDHAVDVRPAWSPDNRSVAYQSNHDGGTFHIYLMNIDGGNQRPLTRGTTDDRHPVWMPDGKAILFDSFNGVHREIWMVNVADGSLKQITRVGGFANFASPSPDGQRISFYLFKDDVLNLWTARPDGSDAKPVTRDLASAKNNQCTFACHQAAWSADGQLLAYSGGNHETIWTVRSDGTEPRQIIADEEHNHFPWFMSDGRLGFVTEHVQPAGKAWTDAWAYDLKSEKRTLLQGQMSVQGPIEWSNDYTKVLFHSPRGGNFDIYLIDLSAPGGVDALQGNPVPADQVGVAVTNSSTSLPAANAQGIIASITIGVAFLAVLTVLGVGLFVRLKRRSA